MQELQQQTMLSPAPPSMATHGMTLPIHPGIPMVPGGFPSLPTSAPAPMPSAPAMVVHHHPGPAVTISIHHPGPGPNVPISIPQNKRRRFDGPAQVFAGAQSTQVPKSNGHVVPHVMPITTSNAIPGRGRQKSQVQIDRRRERNRILARRTRLRKKFFFESLQKDVNDLQRENTVLKELVKKKFDSEAAKQLLAECNAMESLPNDVQEAVFENADLDNQDFNLVRSIQSSQQCFIITDPSLQDNPIVFASDDFLTLTGYEREEVLGRNCRFLQGTGTSVRKIEQVRKSISMGEDVSVTMINYTADGTAFWNKLFIAALRDAHNNIVNFIGVIVKVAAPEPDDPEAGRRLPGGGQPGDQTTANGEEGDIHNEDDDQDEDAAIADGTVRAMEGAVSAAVSAANGVALSSAVPATDGVAVNAAVPATDGVDLSSAVPATDGVDLS
jgi:PAS domain S-box-containing protein